LGIHGRRRQLEHRLGHRRERGLVGDAGLGVLVGADLFVQREPAGSTVPSSTVPSASAFVWWAVRMPRSQKASHWRWLMRVSAIAVRSLRVGEGDDCLGPGPSSSE
jgi:hypothetical protein